MTDRKIDLLAERIEREFLPFVRQPARYIGGEINAVRKDLDRCDLKFALCFPDTYEVGMSNTGLSIVYHVLNRANARMKLSDYPAALVLRAVSAAPPDAVFFHDKKR